MAASPEAGTRNTRLILMSIACLVLLSVVGVLAYAMLSNDKEETSEERKRDARRPRAHKPSEQDRKRRRGGRDQGQGDDRRARQQKPAVPPEVVMARLQERERWFVALAPDPNRAKTEASQQESLAKLVRRLGLAVTSLECHVGACRVWLAPDPTAEAREMPPPPTDRVMKEKWHLFHYQDGAELRTLLYVATQGTLPNISTIQATAVATTTGAASAAAKATVTNPPPAAAPTAAPSVAR